MSIINVFAMSLVKFYWQLTRLLELTYFYNIMIQSSDDEGMRSFKPKNLVPFKVFLPMTNLSFANSSFLAVSSSVANFISLKITDRHLIGGKSKNVFFLLLLCYQKCNFHYCFVSKNGVFSTIVLLAKMLFLIIVLLAKIKFSIIIGLNAKLILNLLFISSILNEASQF